LAREFDRYSEIVTMTTVLIIWAILGPSIGLLAGCLLNAGAFGDERLKERAGADCWKNRRGHHRHS